MLHFSPTPTMPPTPEFYGPTPQTPKFQPTPPTPKFYGPTLPTNPQHPRDFADSAFIRHN